MLWEPIHKWVELYDDAMGAYNKWVELYDDAMGAYT